MAERIIRVIELIGTTSGGGLANIAGETAVNGFLYAVEWIDGDLADGVDAVLSLTNTPSGVDRVLLTLSNANADAWYYPAAAQCDLAGVALPSGAVYQPCIGTPSLMITDGGSEKTGGCYAYFLV